MKAGLFLILVAVAIVCIGFVAELRAWNKGRCPKCGNPWRNFDTDSQGGRGYSCGCRRIWISYPIDRRRG